MRINSKILVGFAFFLFATPGFTTNEEGPEVKLKERWRYIVVTAKAPIPEEMDNETQARAVSREAAIVMAQTKILSHILEKKARSGRTLKVAEVPSLELQGQIRGYVKGAQVKSALWKDGWCTVKLVLGKRELKKMLKKN